MLLGVAHDAPGLTDPARCRFDACIWWTDLPRKRRHRPMVSARNPCRADRSRRRRTSGRTADWLEAYLAIVDRIAARTPRVELIGLPAIESYHTTVINPEAILDQRFSATQ